MSAQRLRADRFNELNAGALDHGIESAIAFIGRDREIGGRDANRRSRRT